LVAKVSIGSAEAIPSYASLLTGGLEPGGCGKRYDFQRPYRARNCVRGMARRGSSRLYDKLGDRINASGRIPAKAGGFQHQ
jgi:hypothetical protein